jgi:putative GTP pyrophosphokinase
MVLERKIQFNIPALKQQFGEFQSNFKTGSFTDSRVFLLEFAGISQVYSAAMKNISIKLEVLYDEFRTHHNHNPIHHVECRMKSIKSIHEKTQRYGVPFTLDSIKEHIQDISGIRVICNFIDDIYDLEKLLLKQADITLVEREDYIKQPKKNGYRSLHLIVKTPVFLSDRIENIPVEIQLRTIAMDYWASLDHMLHYKNCKIDKTYYSEMLLNCSISLADTEKEMQQIRNYIEKQGRISARENAYSKFIPDRLIA